MAEDSDIKNCIVHYLIGQTESTFLMDQVLAQACKLRKT